MLPQTTGRSGAESRWNNGIGLRKIEMIDRDNRFFSELEIISAEI
jgi:hypothetical protein